MTDRLPKSSQGALPPWLWFWLGATLLSALREGRASWLSPGIGLFTGLNEFISQDPLFRLVGLAFALPVAVVLAGVTTVLLPWVRAAYLEWWYSLEEVSPQLLSEAPELIEISEFVHAHDPSIRIKVNLAIQDNALVSRHFET